MSTREDELVSLRETFFEEASERLSEVEGLLLELEQRPDDDALIAPIFRAIHSLKSGGAACDLMQLANFAHVFENLLDQLRKGHMRARPSTLEVLLASTDALGALVNAARGTIPPVGEQEVSQVSERIQAELASAGIASVPPPPKIVSSDGLEGLVIWDDEPAPEPKPVSLRPIASVPPVARPAASRPASIAPPSIAPPSIAPEPEEIDLDVVFLCIGEACYFVPLANVERYFSLAPGMLHTLPLLGEVIESDGRALPAYRLRRVLGRTEEDHASVAVVLHTRAGKLALLVDEVRTQTRVVVRPLYRGMGEASGLLGAALDAEAVVLVLDPEAIARPRRAPTRDHSIQIL